MDDYEEYLAKKEDWENRQYERILEEQKKAKMDFHRILKHIKKLGDYIIENDIDVSIEQEDLYNQIKIIESMLL